MTGSFHLAGLKGLKRFSLFKVTMDLDKYGDMKSQKKKCYENPNSLHPL